MLQPASRHVFGVVREGVGPATPPLAPAATTRPPSNPGAPGDYARLEEEGVDEVDPEFEAAVQQFIKEEEAADAAAAGVGAT